MSVQNSDRQGCFSYILGFLQRIIGHSSKTPTILPYRLRDDFLSATELSYFKILNSVLGPRATLCTKVNLTDIIFVAKTDQYMSFFNRISQRHVDFLLCESSTMKPVLAIELDDVSHSRPSRKERDLFLDEALRAAGLPILRVVPKKQYTQAEVVSQLKPFLPDTKSQEVTPYQEKGLQPQAVISKSDESMPICPICGVPMVLRVASKGRQKGNQFYGCSNFPKCRQVLPINSRRASG